MSEAIQAVAEAIATHKQPDTIKGVEETPSPPTQVKTDEPLSPRLAAMAKKERAIREQAKKLQSEREALAREQEELKQTKSWKTRLSEDPLTVMSEAGIGYDQLTQLILNQGTPENTQYQKLRQELKSELKSHEEQIRSQLEEQKTQQYEQAKAQIKKEVSLLVDSNENYEAIQGNGELAKEAVVELIEQTFKDEGYLMSIDEAAQSVEDHLVEQAFQQAKWKKVQAKLMPPPAEAPQGEQKIIKPPEKTLSTLSNRISGQTTKPLSAKERRERAILAFQGKL